MLLNPGFISKRGCPQGHRVNPRPLFFFEVVQGFSKVKWGYFLIALLYGSYTLVVPNFRKN